ncbi:MAG: DUF4974 domain-containing protein [Lewinellaceae bacterium]|nr:DUF4974 domain-containing protein [Lewinellaceae bacterium]
MAIDTAAIRSLISKGEVEEALEVVVASIQSFPDPQHKNEVLHLASRYRENSKRKLQGLIDEREFQLIHNQALMEFIGLLDSLDGKIAGTDSPTSKKNGAFLANFKINHGSLHIGCTLVLSLLLCFGVALYYFYDFPSLPKYQIAKTMVGERQELILPDSSVVFLNEQTSLYYPIEISDDYTVKMKGEAYFAIRHTSKRVFNIESGDVHLTVLGTKFNLRAYPNEPFVEVEMESGLMRMTSSSEQGSIMLEAGNKGTYQTDNKQIRVEKISSFNASSWNTRRLVFRDTPLSDVVETLERNFKVQFEFKDNGLVDCHFTSEYPERLSLEEILEMLQFTMNIEITKEGDTIYLEGQGCQ